MPSSFTARCCAVLFALYGAAAAAESPQRLLQNAGAAELTAWAQRYEHGEGVDRSPYWAIRLYCAAARKDYPEAQHALGWIYANGRGIGRDEALAAAWLRRAARKGYSESERLLAYLGASDARRVRARCKLPLPEQRRAAARTTENPRYRQIRALVDELAPGYQLDPELVLTVIAAESGFDPRARSPKNAQGLMQLIPATAARFGVEDPYDLRQNLRGGMAYLRWLLAYYQGDVELALAGYNAGEKAVDRHRGVPPYPETRDYVSKILGRYGRTRHPPVSQVVEPSALLASR